MAPHQSDRRALMHEFADMYRAKRFDPAGFDYEGYLQTTLSDESHMPLEFFVEYNNVWWYAIISGVEVPMVAYDSENDSGSIVLDISYDGDLLRAMQHVHFNGDRIDRIRTYASGTFFTGSNPLVQLDRHGNTIWLETGYDLATSARAAGVFLDTPRGRAFEEDRTTAAPVARIRENLADLEERMAERGSG